MDELPHLRLFTKVAVFLCWAFGSLLTLVGSFLLLFDYFPLPGRIPPFLEPQNTYQLFQARPKTGQVLGASITGKDARSEILKNYLQLYHSPLAEHAGKLVRAADKNALPWTLLPAIAGKESGFGKVIPFGSFNAWGWGVYTGKTSGASFSSWPDAIEKVAQGLRREYFDKGFNTVEKIEAKYTPSSLNRGHTWQNGVNYFIWELENFAQY